MSIRPRYGMKSIMLTVLVFAVLFAWIGAQLDWIRQRHRFNEQHPYQVFSKYLAGKEIFCPWQLRLFGEEAHSMIPFLLENEVAEAKRLFPEAEVDTRPWPVNGPHMVTTYPPTRPAPPSK